MALVLNLILGSFFALTLVRSPGGELILTILVASVSFCCLAGVGALLLRLRKATCWAIGGAALALLALSVTLAVMVLGGSNRFVLPLGLMIVVALLGFAGLFGWLAIRLTKTDTDF